MFQKILICSMNHHKSFIFNSNVVKQGHSFVHVLTAMKVYFHSQSSLSKSLFVPTRFVEY